MELPNYVYNVELIKVVDYNKVEVTLDLGFSLKVTKTFTIFGLEKLKNTNLLQKYITELLVYKKIYLQSYIIKNSLYAEIYLTNSDNIFLNLTNELLKLFYTGIV